MQVEIVIKLIGVVAAIFSLGKIIYDITTGQKSRLREEYKFARVFFEDLKNNPNLHPFALEKGYQAIVGSTAVKVEEIAYLLSLKNPGQCLHDYFLSKKYLQKLNPSESRQLNFSKKYSSPLSRNLRKGVCLVLYVIFACIAISPLFFSKYFRFLVITLPTFGYYALASLKISIKIYRGEQLVKNQEKHTPSIQIPSHTNTYSLKK